ncbi:MAG: UDP-N-acetylglucosamine 2-epimerase, partial [Pseudomonadota bacterium]
GYGIVTLHRPSNVDEHTKFARIVDALTTVAQKIPLIFPTHPRTAAKLDAFDLRASLADAGVKLVPPQSYLPFMALVKDAGLIITDSGGLQEETTYLGIPCLTLRDNTERPITIDEGTNRLVTADTLPGAVEAALAADAPEPKRPEFWDGRTAAHCVDDLRRRSETGARATG